MQLVGYTDRLSVAPGEAIAFMISSQLPRYRAGLVRLIHGDTNPAGPGFKAEPVPTELTGEYQGELQKLRPGSYVRIPFSRGLSFGEAFTLQMWIRPTLPENSRQTLVSAIQQDGSGFALRLENGRLGIQIDRALSSIVQKRLQAHHWYFVAVSCNRSAGEVRVVLDALAPTAAGLSHSEALQLQGGSAPVCADLLIGAESMVAEDSREVGNFYNGKIDTPRLYNCALSEFDLKALRDGSTAVVDGLIAVWDFSRNINSSRITDVSGNSHHGWTVNRPTRAVAGRTWDGSEVAWKADPTQYAAIHFHEDDLDDAGWQKSIEWTVPHDIASGIYALHIYGTDAEDYLPFAIRPKRGEATSEIVFLMPTFSYLAYGNNHMADRPELIALAKIIGATHLPRYAENAEDKYIVANRLCSLYDTHTDGSGCHYASWLRPIVSMRPKYVTELLGLKGPRQLAADLYLVDWLIENGFRFDVIADENLHLEGREILDPYKVLLTGTHPEYWSEQMVRACQQYLRAGGRMMYLGGNGMYWVTQLDPESGHSIEMRRTLPSSPRFFDPHPGELHLSTTGQRAAPWRQRGLPTHEWLGVVMSGAGRTGQHYVRCPHSYDEGVAWIFEGIGKNELIGNFRSLYTGYGAAGGEVDRVNLTLEGTPHHTMILASTPPFDRTWLWDPLDRPNHPRGDLAFLQYPNGGAVFSTASIAWCSCLSYNRYDNNVSRITRNVLEGFLKRHILVSPKRTPPG